jgi:putative solute:sodium symporter small subunit
MEERMSGKLQEYWRKNISIMTILLAIWGIASYGCGIFFAEALNSIHLAGFPLGFWFAQQGSIYIFVILIFVYFYYMEGLDRKYEVNE